MLTPRQLARLRKAPPEPNRLKAAMTIAGVTQIHVAAGTGITQSHISKVATKAHRVSLTTASRLAGYFGCHVSDLFPRETSHPAASSFVAGAA